MGPAAALVVGLVAVASSTTAAPARGQRPRSPGELGEAGGPSWLFTAVARTTPPGGLLGAEAVFDLGLDHPDLEVSAGASLAWAYYWAELGPKLEARWLDGFLVGQLWLGVEPGDFIRCPEGGCPAPGPNGAAAREALVDAPRRPGLRGLVRSRLELNLRRGDWWLYSRSTLEARLRSFTEYDPFRDVVLGTELSGEQAVAPLYRLVRLDGDRGLWAYAEWTVAAELRAGILDARPSVGVIWETGGGVTIDLDLYYGLREGRLGGPGALVFFWWRR